MSRDHQDTLKFERDEKKIYKYLEDKYGRYRSERKGSVAKDHLQPQEHSPVRHKRLSPEELSESRDEDSDRHYAPTRERHHVSSEKLSGPRERNLDRHHAVTLSRHLDEKVLLVDPRTTRNSADGSSDQKPRRQMRHESPSPDPEDLERGQSLKASGRSQRNAPARDHQFEPLEDGPSQSSYTLSSRHEQTASLPIRSRRRGSDSRTEKAYKYRAPSREHDDDDDDVVPRGYRKLPEEKLPRPRAEDSSVREHGRERLYFPR